MLGHCTRKCVSPPESDFCSAPLTPFPSSGFTEEGVRRENVWQGALAPSFLHTTALRDANHEFVDGEWRDEIAL